MKLQLVPNWREGWRLASVRLHLAATAFLAVYALVPSVPLEVQALIPVRYRVPLVAAWAIAGVLTRLIQKKTNG